MRIVFRAALLCAAFLATQAHAFDFAISEFKVVRNGVTIFNDSFTATAPPAAPNFGSGSAASYTLPAGSFSAAVGGKLHLNSAAATISPAVSAKLAVAAHLNTSKDVSDLTSGLKPGTAIEVSGTWDAVIPAGAQEAYFIELGDWENKACSCIRVGVVRPDEGTVVIRFWRDSIGDDAVLSRTELSSVAFAPGASQQILFKLKKAGADSNAVTASYTFISDGVAGTEVALPGTSDLFSARRFAVAAFKASAPVAYATTQGTNSRLTLDANVNVANSHVGRTGNIYVAALFQGMVFFNNGTTWVQWTSGGFPAYATGVSLGDRSLNVLSGLDVSGLTGAIVIVGYGQNDQDLLDSSAYETIYTVQ